MARHRAERTRTSTARRRLAAAALALIGVAGLGLASAAQLNVSSGSLGAGTAVVASCQPVGQPITVGFTTTFGGGAYQATHVRFSGVDASCGGRTYQITVLNTANQPIGSEYTGTVTLTGGVFTVDIADAAASTIGGVAVVIR
jgi:hypothetical protein